MRTLAQTRQRMFGAKETTLRYSYAVIVGLAMAIGSAAAGAADLKIGFIDAGTH